MDVNIYMGCIRILLCVLSFGWNKLWTVTNNKKSILNDLNFAALLFTCESEALDQFLPQSPLLFLRAEISPREETFKNLVDVLQRKVQRASGHLTGMQFVRFFLHIDEFSRFWSHYDEIGIKGMHVSF